MFDLSDRYAARLSSLLREGDESASGFAEMNFDVLDGTVKGFASNDSALGLTELLKHYQAFAAVPEPSRLGFVALGGLRSLRRNPSPGVGPSCFAVRPPRWAHYAWH